MDAKRIRVVERARVQDKVAQELNVIQAVEPSASSPSKTYYAFYAGNESNTVNCVIGGISHPMLVDSGADANLITDGAWETFKSAGIEVIHSEKGSDRVLKSYANNIPLTVLGTFKAVLMVGSKSI